MNEFTVRIEMHGASRPEYDTLHEKMERAGYRRFMTGYTAAGQPGAWLLPTAEYSISLNASADQVRNQAKGIADSVRAGSWCLVTQVAARSISSELVK